LGFVFRWYSFVLKAFADFSIRLGFGTESSLRYYYGTISGEVVAKAMLFLGAGVAGIYDAAVHPKMRRRGIGAAITLAPPVDAHEEGYRVVILHATKMGFSLYQRLGFREYCKFGNYVWIAEKQT
jgi:ribosomal protein S18 acetylase RimI-like enzyme